MAYVQSTVVYRSIYLTLANAPATGLTYAQISCQYKKSGGGSFVTKVLGPSDWTEYGDGIYSVKFLATDVDTVGDFTFTLGSIPSSPVLFDNLVFDEFTIIPPPSNVPAVVLPKQCIVSGTLSNQSALPPINTKLVFRPKLFPAEYGSTLIVADPLYTYTDAYGNFSIALVQGSVVLVDIERAGIRGVQFTVPNSTTANFLDLIPPIPNDFT